MVRLRVVNRKGDSVLNVSLEEARQEIQTAIDRGYIPVSNNRQVSVNDIQENDEVTLFPMGQGG